MNTELHHHQANAIGADNIFGMFAASAAACRSWPARGNHVIALARSNLALAGLAELLLLLSSHLLCAASFQVNSTEDTVDVSPGDGVAADALGQCTLRAAIMEANATVGASTITLHGGAYALSIAGVGEDAAVTGDLDIRCELTIAGAGAATTVIDGGALDRVFHIHPGSNVTLSGLTIRNGTTANGAGILNKGSLTLNEVVVSGNQAVTEYACGGGIFNDHILTLNNSLVTGNQANYGGGGLYLGGSVNLNATVVSDNVVTRPDGNGGGLYASIGSRLTIMDSLIRSNTAAFGAGVFSGGWTEIQRSTCVGNTATVGGGIFIAEPGAVTLNNSTLGSNTATGHGGAIKNQNTLIVQNSTLNGNSGGAMGGAIYNGSSCVDEPAPNAVAALINSTLSGNAAGQGGGVRNSGGTLTLNHCTLTGNEGVGGGLKTGANGTATVKNSIIAYNKLGDHTTPNDCAGVVTSLGYNLVSDGSAGLTGTGDLNNTDPLLGPLADNGGPTRTHALLPNSPALDAVPVASCSVAGDQRGVSRPQGPGCDIGAYEADCSTSTVILNTGYDHLRRGVYAIGEADAFWQVTQDTDGQSNEPRAATAILQMPQAWHDPEPGSQWISSRSTAQQNVNGAYVFETKFCLLEGWSNAELGLTVRADDQADVYLNDALILQTPEGTFWYNHEPASITVNLQSRFRTGANSLKVQVNNIHSVAMGLDLVGSVTGNGLALERPSCCQPEASLSGQAFNDRDGDGVWDAGEPGLSQQTIILSSGTNLVGSTITDGYGYFYFVGLAHRDYAVAAVPSAGWIQTAPTGGVYTVTLMPAQSVNRLNFGCHYTATNAIPLSASVVSTNLQLSWPAAYTGWQLEAQTNAPGVGLSTNWFTVPNSTLTNQLTVPMDPTSPCVFFRLRHIP